jgi:hypothetical protein
MSTARLRLAVLGETMSARRASFSGDRAEPPCSAHASRLMGGPRSANE